MLTLVLQIFCVVLLFTLVVAVHELGHYLFARWRGMDVEEFCILGLPAGPKVVLWRTRSGMPVTMHPLLPLGGFVRIKGMEPKADGSELRVSRGFYSRGLGSRALVLFAGPLFSILFGWLFFVSEYSLFGLPKTEPIIVDRFTDNSAAQAAGLRAGDRIVSVDGKRVTEFEDMRKIVNESANKPLLFVIERGGQTQNLQIIPKLEKPAPGLVPKSDEKPRGIIGVHPKVFTQRVSLMRSFGLASEQVWAIIAGTASIFSRPAEIKDNVGGVISIAKVASASAQEGPDYFLMLAGIISVSLGLINLIPIPLMDGGQLAVVAVEALRGGRRLSIKTQELIGFVGLVLIGLLFLSVTYLDINRWFGKN